MITQVVATLKKFFVAYGEVLNKYWRDLVGLGSATALIIGFAVMTEAAALLAGSRTATDSLATMSTLTTPKLPKPHDIQTALSAWAGSGGSEAAASWIRAHVIADSWTLTPILAAVLALLIGFTAKSSWARPLVVIPPLLYLISDELENTLTFILAGQVANNPPNVNGPLTVLLSWVTLMKGLFVLGCLIIAVLAGVSRRQVITKGGVPAAPVMNVQARQVVLGIAALTLVPAAVYFPSGAWKVLGIVVLAGGVRVALHAVQAAGAPKVVLTGTGQAGQDLRFGAVLWRFRVHVAVILAVGVLMAMPGSGPLNQLPDVIRARYQPFVWGQLWVSAAIGAAFCLVILLTGFAYLHSDTASGATVLQRSQLTPTTGRIVYLCVIVLLAVAATIIFLTIPEMSAAVFVIPAVVAIPFLVIIPVRKLQGAQPQPAPGMPPPPSSESSPAISAPKQGQSRMKRVVAILVVAPGIITGVGLIRAAAGPMLLHRFDQDRGSGTSQVGFFYFGLGLAVLAVAAFPIVFMLLRTAEKHIDQPRWAWAVAMVVGLGFFVWGLDSTSMGSVTGANDVLLAVGIAVVGILGGLGWLSERLAPPRSLIILRLRRTPVAAAFLVVLITASAVQQSVAYHSTPLIPTAASRIGVGSSLTLDTAVKLWRVKAAACRPDSQELPMVLVAAPGGGIRAPYWTEQGMQLLTEANLAGISAAGASPNQVDPACAASSLFMTSGVSGGSLGLAAWASVQAGAQQNAGPRQLPSAQQVVTDLSQPKALSTDFAAMLFRDVPAALVGDGGSGHDRESLSEKVMARSSAHFTDDFYDVTMQTALAGVTGTSTAAAATARTLPWRPFLLFNSTDLSTGCKLIVSQISGLGASPDSDCSRNPASSGRIPAWDVADYLSKPCEKGDTCTDANQSSCEDGSAGCCQTGRTLSILSAAQLSARFPIITPAGALTRCVADPAEPASASPKKAKSSEAHLYAGDGGYYENSGVQTTLQLLSSLIPIIDKVNGLTVDAAGNRNLACTQCIVPHVVVLENDVEPVNLQPRGSRLEELPAILSGHSKADPAAEATLIDQVRSVLSDTGGRFRLGDGRFAATAVSGTIERWSPLLSPDISAPLGWTLSATTRVSLTEEMRQVCSKGPTGAAGTFGTLVGNGGGSASSADQNDNRGVSEILTLLAGAPPTASQCPTWLPDPS